MASYTGAAKVQTATLTASTVDTVTLSAAASRVEVINQTGTALIYYNVGVSGSPPAAPTIGGQDCYAVPAAVCSYEVVGPGEGPTVVQLISSGAQQYTVVVTPL